MIIGEEAKMNKKEINRKNTINRNKFKLTISFAWFIFAYAIIVIGGTYAYQTFTASSANAASGTGGYPIQYALNLSFAHLVFQSS